MTDSPSISGLQDVVGRFIAEHTVDPARQLVLQDFQAQDDLANLCVLHQVLQRSALNAGPQSLDNYLAEIVEQTPDNLDLAEILSRAELTDSGSPILRTLYCSYVSNLASWSTISILSASYLGALVVTRSLLEVVVSAGSGISGKMSERISALTFLHPDEIRVVSECWRELSGWAHGYPRWLKRLCPVLVARGPLHHPEMVRECTVLLAIVTDLAFAVGFAKLMFDAGDVRDLCDEMHVNWRRFMMLRRRIERALPKDGQNAS
jgi:hypothetical protein